MALGSEKTIFLTALEAESAQEREDYLDQACRGNPKLRDAVAELLREHEHDENFLDRPLPGLPSKMLDETPDYRASELGSVDASGTVIGSYRLMEQIGEGGFGLVYVAQQHQPVRRLVALKIIKPGMESRDVIARFEAERQALALMDHPNIARVFDAGVTETGRPYFVMELVRGVPVTEFCDNHRLDGVQRLELFITICHAVQHAHQKGIIHRDLKPTNVLVTLQDGAPVAKVIDFGVAKAIGQTLTNKTIYTRFTSMIGTPTYMSPEQAEMSNVDIDTRSDIYSLGILLYELLTGSTPLARENLENASFDELRRLIREDEPPRPSARLSTLSGTVSSTVSASRRVEPSKLTSLVRGDLDWIVMKAIDKDRNRRYAAAGDLAQDVRRFLTQQPIAARPPSAAYRFSKFARRNKVTITTALLVTAVLVLGTVASAWQARVALRERDEKVAALHEATLAHEEISQFATRLKEANALLASGRAHAEAQRWEAASADYTRATKLQPNYYHVWVERGSLYVRLGLWQAAADDFVQASKLGALNGPEWWGVPQLLWYVGDQAAYRELCDAILTLARSSPNGQIGDALRGCLFADLSNEALVELAEKAELSLDMPPWPPADVARIPRDRQGRDGPRRFEFDPPHMPGPDHRGPFLGPRLYVAGWAHYRAGDYERAIERLEESNTLDHHWPGGGLSYPLIAMSQFRMGQLDDAQVSP